MFKIKDPTKEIRSILAKAGDQTPYALRLTINDLAFEARQDFQTHLRRILKAPIPFTVRGVLVDKAVQTNLRAYVYVRDEVARYLRPNIYGTDRNKKGVEVGLSARSLFGRRSVPSGVHFIAARGFQTGPRGRITKAKAREIVQETKKQDGRYFLFQDDKDGRFYVFQKGRGKNIKLALIGVNKPRYSKRLDFYGTVNRTIATNYARIATAALNKALPPSNVKF